MAEYADTIPILTEVRDIESKEGEYCNITIYHTYIQIWLSIIQHKEGVKLGAHLVNLW